MSQSAEHQVPSAGCYVLKPGTGNWMFNIDITQPPDTQAPEAQTSNNIVKFHQVPSPELVQPQLGSGPLRPGVYRFACILAILVSQATHV
jgi:hypothetical protein